MPPLSYCVHTHLATPLHPTPPICGGRSCIHPLLHLSSTSAILILYGGDVDASTRRWRPSSLLSLYFSKEHSGCLGAFLGAREELQRAAWEGVERPPKWMHPSIGMCGGSPASSFFLTALPCLSSHLPAWLGYSTAMDVLVTARSVVALVFLEAETQSD